MPGRSSAGGSLQGLVVGGKWKVVRIVVVGSFVGGSDGRALPLEGGIPMVLDGVVGATGEQSGDGGPFVAELGMSPDDGVIFIGSEGTVLDLRGELVAPA